MSEVSLYLGACGVPIPFEARKVRIMTYCLQNATIQTKILTTAVVFSQPRTIMHGRDNTPGKGLFVEERILKIRVCLASSGLEKNCLVQNLEND